LSDRDDDLISKLLRQLREETPASEVSVFWWIDEMLGMGSKRRSGELSVETATTPTSRGAGVERSVERQAEQSVAAVSEPTSQAIRREVDRTVTEYKHRDPGPFRR
jgi:hypothetical protein